MGTRFSRAQINERLRKTVESGQPLLGAGSSAGIVAKCAEIGGADLIIVYSTGRSRLMGLPTTPLGDANTVTLSMVEEIANVVSETPIIGGAEAADPQHLDLSRLIDKFLAAGFDGLINFPTLGNFPERDRQRSDVGLGFDREVQMIRKAAEADVWTMAYAFNPEHARAMADAGTDCIVAHVGWTAGGLSGATNSTRPRDRALQQIEDMFLAARDVNPDVFCLGHGGDIALPGDTADLYRKTRAQGFVGASSIERIPIERAVTDVAKEFKAVPLSREHGRR